MLVSLEQALELLKSGQPVAVPTETVYGLAVDASNPEAIERVYQLKGRPSGHPVILHVADYEMALPYLQSPPSLAKILADAFWPGPLTMILERSGLVADQITGGRSTVGVRAPGAKAAQDLLGRLGRPFVAPSANRFGHTSPTIAAHVEEEFEGRVPVIDGGSCSIGIESTIVRVEPDCVTLLRPGILGAKEIENAISFPVRLNDKAVWDAPGGLKRHYAPKIPAQLISKLEIQNLPKNVALLYFSQMTLPKLIFSLRLPDQPLGYARQLYAALRQAEASKASRIAIEMPPDLPNWSALRDRLIRAAT